ncbi:winged helix-turn-helix transcriptional regulator [Hymenobacter cellulosivorans]|uniref:Helix-turn-helix transcriptional regulator n=1 Tax=Hymenobacter cellulosivorans TaxID=2932249 RepID=A0ABY4F907_9BACT|nr:helix-turn-helix domain-containing protein [Hymenobacter cellulosivorans]UOQ52894.1 helix-turn-helix transcriptional regulator [Hymenobacter cellulosivorans]
MRHTYHDVEFCATRVALGMLAGKWKPILFFHLFAGPRRFTELWRDIPRVSKKVLLEQLRQLEAAGLVERTVHNGFPPEVSYQLSAKGAELGPILHRLDQWAVKHIEGVVQIS